jgi:hypothetical protein
VTTSHTRGTGALACLGAALLLVGCGGGAKSHRTQSSTTHAGALPAEAHIKFVSDRAVAHVVSPHLGGTVVASINFDPTHDGFAFQNYGFIAGTDLDQHAMRELFGDAVCADTPSDNCTLTPAAQQWAQSTSEQMVGGHCFGFSVTALRFFTHNLNQSDFGGSTTYSLPFTSALQGEIGYGWATQVLPLVQQESITGTPSQIVNDLIKAMNSKAGPIYSLGFFNADGAQRSEGHAVTPIAVENLGGGRYNILIYDNNKPDSTQAIAVDTNQQTWSYQVAINPTQPNAVWSGQGTNNEIDLTPLSAITRRQPCPFCKVAGTTGVDTISLGGNPVQHAHLLITTADGRRLGYLGGRFVDQIPGSHVIHPDLSEIWKAAPEPVYQVPANLRLTVTLQGGNPSGQDQAQVHVTGPGFGATVANLTPSSSTGAQLTVLPDGTQVTLRLTGSVPSQAPSLQLARDTGRKGKELTVAPKSLAAGTRLSVGIQPTGKQVSVKSTGSSTAATVTLRSVGPTGSHSVNHTVGLAAGQQTTLSLGLIKIG